MKRSMMSPPLLMLFQVMLLVPHCFSWYIPEITARRITSKLFANQENAKQENADPSVWVTRESGGWDVAPPKHHAAIETLRWCNDFVLPLNLCPWAAASVQSDKGIQLYSVKKAEDMEAAVYDVTQLFHQSIVEKKVDPSVAISFILCEDLSWDFSDFYDWFCALEEDYWDDDNDLQSKVTLAPFHPGWKFQGDEPSLQFEKKSPYPTVTLVWTDVIDAAGEAVTSKIALQNEETLCGRSVQELDDMYKQNVYLQRSDDSS